MRRAAAITAIILELLWPVPLGNEPAQAKAEPAMTPAPSTYQREIVHTPAISRGTQDQGREMVIQATAYTHTGHKTFTETWPHRGTVAVDPKVIPLGSRIWVEGYGWGLAEDTGGLIKGRIIDLFMETKGEAVKWGRQNIVIRVYPPAK